MSYVKLSDHVYHIGDTSTMNGLDCNPYLLMEGDEAVLFDPGSSLDFEVVLDNLKTLVGLEKIKYIVLHHEDPDFCAAVPLLEKAGVRAQIITSWRAMTLIVYYGIQSPFYLIEEHDMKLVLQTGRVLEFIPTPYLHFAGSFASYEKRDKMLFSSDLFGAFTYNRTFYADESYLDKMLAFHENYMPSNSVLRPVMDVLLTYDIRMILPQHGSIITKDIRSYMTALRTLECGNLLKPLKKNLLESGGFTMILNEVIKRLYSLYPNEEVGKIFKCLPDLVLNDAGEVVDYHDEGETVLNSIFEQIKSKMGIRWIIVMEPFIRNLSAVYDLKIPAVFNSAVDDIVSENLKLLEMNRTLNLTVASVNDKLLKCPVTGLFNETFLRSLLVDEVEKEDWRDLGALVCVSIDNFTDYQLTYGSQEENSVLNNLAYIFKENFGVNAVYRLEYADFALYIKGVEKSELLTRLDAIRVEISRSDLFLGSLTLSAGVVFPHEIGLTLPSYEATVREYMNISLNRLRFAKIKGKNMICHQYDVNVDDILSGTVLVVDSDETNIELLKNFIGEAGIRVLTARDGVEAYEAAMLHKPEIIISEIFLNKMDGFVLREQILQNSVTKDIETIFLSYKKDEDSVERALGLGVTYYIKKPYLLSELVGIIKRKVKGLGA